MGWTLNKSRPICPQICETMCVMISSSEIKPGEKLMSVREVAVNAGVNPNTVQKSFEQLEQKGIIYSVRGSGWYVSENTEIAKNECDALVNERVLTFFDDMLRLGVEFNETKKIIKEWEI